MINDFTLIYLILVTPEKYCGLNMDLYQNQIMCMPSNSASIQTTIQTEPLIYGMY